jgi:hypothetical protein
VLLTFAQVTSPDEKWADLLFSQGSYFMTVGAYAQAEPLLLLAFSAYETAQNEEKKALVAAALGNC